MKYVSILWVFLIASCAHRSSDATLDTTVLDSLQADLDSLLVSGKLPGFAISIFSEDSLYVQRGFGLMDLENDKLYRAESVQCMASVSKTFIGVSLMLAIDRGLMNLDDPVSNYITFPVMNAMFPDKPLTLRMLANHTSSLSDEGVYEKAYVFDEGVSVTLFPEAWHDYVKTYKSNVKLDLDAFFVEVFEDLQYSDNEPGTYYAYSNLGSSLLALAIQNATKTPYDQFVEREIWEPLGMSQTTWSPEQIPTRNRTVHYLENGSIAPDYELNTYPDGYAHSSVVDLTKFLQEMIKGYKGEGTLLSKESYLKMFEQVHEEIPDAICWDLAVTCCIGHAGNDFGTATMMFFEKGSGVGRILFTNKSLETEELNEQYYAIFNTLFEYSF